MGTPRTPARSLTWSSNTGLPVNGDMSQASITSNPVNLDGTHKCSFQLQYSGTPTGTISFEVSNDADPAASVTGNWDALDSTLFSPALTQPAGAAGTMPVNLTDIQFEWIRVKYTRTGSSGTLTGTSKTKS